MSAHRISFVALLGLATAALTGCHGCGGILDPVFPRMAVTPDHAELDGVPVEQDTKIVFQITALTLDNVEDLQFKLTGDPSFVLDDGGLTEVLGGQTGQVSVTIRPKTAPSTLKATLTVTAAANTKPNKIDVPITVNAIDAGHPVICDYPDAIHFTPDGSSIGEGDVARSLVNINNCGNRDLIIDHLGWFPPDQTPDCTSTDLTKLPDDCGLDATFKPLHDPFGCNGLPKATHVAPATPITEATFFEPTDLDAHTMNLVICSNDTEHEPVSIPADGQAQQCPTACFALPNGDTGLQPFDLVRLDPSCSAPAHPGDAITAFNWSLTTAPVGNQQQIQSQADGSALLETDLAGQYCVGLDVTDSSGVRSCKQATQCFNVVPTEDLHIQLVWDHPTADFDLHVLGDGGTPFTHETDCYFSNRHPTPADCAPDAPLCSWVDNVEQNPSLDHDDNNGYGPENTNIIHPAPGSKWQIDVHYWNKNTDASPAATATLRVFCYGHQAIEVSRHFDDDQQMWEALSLTWPENVNDPCQLSQIGVVEPLPRPF